MTISTERLKEITERRSPSLRWGEAEEIAVELLAAREVQSEPVQWGAPKTVRQLIQQLQTLDPELETTALLRMPADFRDGNAVRQVPLVISYECMDEQWLAPYNGDGRKVLAFWAKADHRPDGERGEVLTTPPATVVPQSDHLRRALKLAGEAKELADRIRAEEQTPPAVLGEQLINIANHIAGSEGGLPDEWKDWANELVSDLRRLAASKSAPILPGDAEFKAWVHDDYNREVTLSCPVNLGIARSAWNTYRDMLTTMPKAD